MTQSLKQHYSVGAVVPEQEALNENNNLVEINLSLEAKVILAYKHQTANRDKLLKKLARANAKKSKQKYKKSFVICKQAVELSDTVLKKIFSGKRVLLNHKYISKITECDSRKQNVRILEQLENLLGIEYHRLAIVDGTPYNYHYSFKLNPTVVEELKDAGAWEAKTIETFLSQPYNNRPHTSSRSNIDLGSNFSSNVNSNTELNTSSPDTKEEQVGLTNKAEAIVEQKQVKLARPANARKKATNAHKKARVLKFPRYTKPKKLADMVPLIDDAICDELRAQCGREFSNNFIRQRTMSMGNKPELDNVSFNYRAGYIGYMGKTLKHELHDAVKTQSESFVLAANLTAVDKLWQQQEKYLAEVEEVAIRQVSPINQFRAKLVNTLESSVAYDLLLAMNGAEEIGNALVMSLNKDVELSKRQKEIVLAQAKAVFNSGGFGGEGGVIESLEFVVKHTEANIVSDLTISCEKQTVEASQSTDMSHLTEWEELELPQGKWGKVCSSFVSEYGFELYNHWLSGLEVTENSKINTIELRTSSDMVRDRIEQTYLPFLSKIAGEFGINNMEFVV